MRIFIFGMGNPARRKRKFIFSLLYEFSGHYLSRKAFEAAKRDIVLGMRPGMRMFVDMEGRLRDVGGGGRLWRVGNLGDGDAGRLGGNVRFSGGGRGYFWGGEWIKRDGR
jgi:hypothetical protein